MNVPVSKTGICASVSWVRIPPSPPVKYFKALIANIFALGCYVLPISLPIFRLFLAPLMLVASRVELIE